jgi:hypothetical protein
LRTLASRGCHELPGWKGRAVLDLLMLALLVVGFAATAGYVFACVNVTLPVNGVPDRQR